MDIKEIKKRGKNKMQYEIPKDKYKKVKIDKSISAIGFRSTSYDFQDKLISDNIQLTIQTDTHDASFKFNIYGRDKVLKLKEAIEFALEIDEEREKIRRENNKKVNKEIRNRAIERDKKENDTYIPKDLDECLIELEKNAIPEDIEKIKNISEEEMYLFHHGTGRDIRNNWGLWSGSPLSKWFNEQGIRHPDDMSGIILKSFWRKINNKPIKLKEQIEYYKNYWKKNKNKK